MSCRMHLQLAVRGGPSNEARLDQSQDNMTTSPQTKTSPLPNPTSQLTYNQEQDATLTAKWQPCDEGHGMNSKATTHQGSLGALRHIAHCHALRPMAVSRRLRTTPMLEQLDTQVRRAPFDLLSAAIKSQVSQATTRRTDARRRKQASHSICRSIGGFVLSVPFFSPTYRFVGGTVDERRFDREVLRRRNLYLLKLIDQSSELPEISSCHSFST